MLFNYTVKSGTQKLIVPFWSRLTTVTTGLLRQLGTDVQTFADVDSAGYIREGATAAVAMVPVTAAVGVWTSLGFIVVDDTNMVGWYQLGVPNAALVNGAKWVDINIEFADAELAESIQIHIDLIRSIAF